MESSIKNAVLSELGAKGTGAQCPADPFFHGGQSGTDRGDPGAVPNAVSGGLLSAVCTGRMGGGPRTGIRLFSGEHGAECAGWRLGGMVYFL